MKQQVDLDKLKSFLRRVGAEATINRTHKAALLNRLVEEYPGRRFAWGIVLPACSAAVVLILAVSIFFWFAKPTMGKLEWAGNSARTESLTGRTRIKTGTNTATVFLDDGSELKLDRSTVFQVLSSSTNRLQEDTIISLERGTLDANVRNDLPHRLIVRTPDVEVTVVGTKFVICVTALP
ncbi:MAG TPA: FecR family protein [bacterium]|nr:FecR family protein [bacterium]